MGDDDPWWNTTSSSVTDNDTVGFLVCGGLKINDSLSFEVGYAHVEHELDMAQANEDATASYYIQATITIAKGFFLVPEIGKVDYKDNAAKVDEGDTVYYGAKWQINF